MICFLTLSSLNETNPIQIFTRQLASKPLARHTGAYDRHRIEYRFQLDRPILTISLPECLSGFPAEKGLPESFKIMK